MPGLEFHAGGHTNSLVPLFAKGSAAKGLQKRAVRTDPMRGPYIDDTDIPNYIKKLLK